MSGLKRPPLPRRLAVLQKIRARQVTSKPRDCPPQGGLSLWLAVVVGFYLSLVTCHLSLASEPMVRVEILPEASSLRVTVPGACKVHSLREPAFVKALPELKWQEVGPHSSGIRVGSLVVPSARVAITPEEGAAVYVNGTRYRGSLALVRLNDRTLRVINVMPLEEYLKGVVPSEVDYRWPLETLKAQAIIARTFTLLQVADRAAHDYDVTRTWPQLYGGLSSERSRAVRAVEATRGLVLMSRGALLRAYYHTVCGGRTEEAREVWPNIQSTSLRGVRCRFCRQAPHSWWAWSVGAMDLEQMLQRQGFSVGSVEAIVTSQRNQSGRVTTVKIVGSLDTSTIPATRFRAALGPNHLRSTNFTVQRIAGLWRFRGRGWGHGVGLCQWGAAMLGRRRTAAQILAFYYPGAQVVPMEQLLGLRKQLATAYSDATIMEVAS